MPTAYSAPATLDATTLGSDLSTVNRLTGRHIPNLRAGPFVKPIQVFMDVVTGNLMTFPNQVVP